MRDRRDLEHPGFGGAVTARRSLPILLACALAGSLAHADVRFSLDVRPILSDACFACHGPDEAAGKAGLRLDLEEGIAGVVTPGSPDASELYQRVSAANARDRMPPPEAHRTLTGAQIGTIKRWIEEGARHEGHWSLQRPQAEEPPADDATGWTRGAIDRFVLSQLTAVGMRPSPEASRERAIRRLSSDLTGLPPTLPEIDDYLNDDTEGAYERVVDRLLASPRYGEHMATSWMDLARFADTYGYQSDVYRDMSPWRDWVIRSYNDNLPFDDFVTWQLAGDLLPDATRDQRLATAFNRNHRQTNEGGSVEEEFRVDYVADRVDTFGAAFLGLTLKCARCHDHKFDPITQRDYYSLFAFFNSIDESGLYPHYTNAVPTPSLLMPDTAAEPKAAELQAEVDACEANIAALRDSRRGAFEAWIATAPALAPTGEVARLTFDSVDGSAVANDVDEEKPGALFEDPQFVDGPVGQAIELTGENGVSLAEVGGFTRSDPFTLAFWMWTPDVKDRAVVVHATKSWTDAGSRGYQMLLEDGRLSASLIHFWPGNALRVVTQERLPAETWTHVGMTYDGSSRASGLQLYVDGLATATDVVRDTLYKGLGYGSPVPILIGARNRDRGFKGGRIDEFRVFSRHLTALEVADVAGHAVDLRDADPADAYEVYLATEDEEALAALDALGAARSERDALANALPEIMTMTETEQPRQTYLLMRGAYDAPGEEVQRDTPSGVMPFPADAPRDRLGLARWLTSPEHPLTARVAVNRLWQGLFGVGLVATPDDFGSQGAAPTHPRLLDHLAAEFVASGWDRKALLKSIVTSATYRQDSVATTVGRSLDPENALLGRGSARRLTAEGVRDSALYVSGLLHERFGGPGVKPYQPDGLWREKNGATYKHDVSAGLYRRSLYTYWKRTSPPPSMLLFDADTREVCVARRQVTNTPMQALVLLNDTQFVEAARAFAEGLIRADDDTDAKRAARAYRMATGREASPRVQSVLAALLGEQRAHFGERLDEAHALLRVGESTPSAELDPTELAATTMLASAVLNLDATVTRR
jgi:hypothetical protein